MKRLSRVFRVRELAVRRTPCRRSRGRQAPRFEAGRAPVELPAQLLNQLRVLAERSGHLAPVLLGHALLHQRLDTVAVALPRPLEGDQRIACGTGRLDEAPEDVTVLGLVLQVEVLCGSHRRTRKRRVDLPRIADPEGHDLDLTVDLELPQGVLNV